MTNKDARVGWANLEWEACETCTHAGSKEAGGCNHPGIGRPFLRFDFKEDCIVCDGYEKKTS